MILETAWWGCVGPRSPRPAPHASLFLITMNTAKHKALLSKPKAASKVFDYGLSTGYTLLNLACNDRPTVGYRPGHAYLFVGDSGAGKTWLTLAALAEAANCKAFDDYDLYFDGPEYGAEMNFAQYFGRKMASRVKPPAFFPDKVTPKYSRTVEGFFGFTDSLFRAGRPFVLVLDSLDVLVPEADLKRARKNNARSFGNEDGEQKGSYGTEKAKLLSQGMRMWMGPLQETGSIIILISQTRTNIGFGSQFQPKTRGGGKAPTFYATLEIWTSVRELIRQEIKGKKRTLGVVVEAKVRKNRQTGKPDQRVLIPIYHSVGIDDAGGCVDFLVDEGHWSKDGGRITATEFGMNLPREKLVQSIEAGSKDKELRLLTAQVWGEIQQAMTVERKRRYE